MANELVINTTSHETRIALIENGTIAELYIERSKVKGIVGNIYLGRVIRVLPGMQAAFVDIGLEKAAFLYVADVFDAIEDFDTFMDGNGKKDESRSRKERRAKRRCSTPFIPSKTCSRRVRNCWSRSPRSRSAPKGRG